MLRILRHLMTPRWLLRWWYPRGSLVDLEQRIAAIEQRHRTEVRLVVEHALDLGDLLARVTPRERALQIFGLQRVWDTEHNNGVLIYVLHAEHAVEVVADRGLSVVPQTEWDALCRRLGDEIRAGRRAAGAAAALEGVARLLEQHPAAAKNAASRNELPDQPLLL